ncbi:hypothetical protein BDV98DRAFT_600080 [Pterulicium gracile]|uniref:PCI domain-containing protein n=1 Tax=Pterulicium gracile TaxID=1884261 RepID=A0A5C3R4Q6_9AGAR|nr:hypothetical protein BDV98DRAFT_600080 [Pterula gracilis]
MDFSTFLLHINDAINVQNGHTLAYMLRPTSPHSKDLVKELRNRSYQSMMTHYRGSLVAPWDELAVRYVVMCGHVARKRSNEAFKEVLEMYSSFLKVFAESNGWLLNVLFSLSQVTRDLALDAEAEGSIQGHWKPGDEPASNAARVVTNGFKLCINDRMNPINVSRKWGVYYIAALVFKFYFKMKQIALAKNILRGVEIADLPALTSYPRSHQVAYRYYLGMIDFMNENYTKAEKELEFAFYNCVTSATANQERILSYLIALRILKGLLPSEQLLSRFENVNKLYTPFIKAIKTGNLKAYDDALEAWESTLLKLSLYLIVERARELCIRGLFRKVWLFEGKATRIAIPKFYASLKVSGIEETSSEEAECFVANMIYKGYMRGYIHHDKQMVLLSKDAFPPLKDRPDPFHTLS